MHALEEPACECGSPPREVGRLLRKGSGQVGSDSIVANDVPDYSAIARTFETQSGDRSPSGYALRALVQRLTPLAALTVGISLAQHGIRIKKKKVRMKKSETGRKRAKPNGGYRSGSPAGVQVRASRFP